MDQSLRYRLSRGAGSAWHALVDLLFPPRCVACGRHDTWFCDACRSQVKRIEPPWCVRCGRPLQRQDCPFCHRFPPDIDGLRAVAFYEGALREAIHAFKYRNRRELAAPLASLLNEYLDAQALPADAIVPVPLYAEREQDRGYNQALLLAHELAVEQKLPMWYNVIKRTRATRPQVELDAHTRRENVRDAFAATPAVAGVRVLLIDDVCTTGATMEACSIALRARGAKSVWGLALARGR